MAAPTQALVTFLVETDRPAHSVQLLGSWDNFSTPYQMIKDRQKGGGHWHGCFLYDHIICDGDPTEHTSAREGRLLMGGTYWYYYKFNDDVEFHDATRPSTTQCPLLPGQSVNILEMPHEELPSLEDCPPKSLLDKVFTLNPADRYNKPVPRTRPSRPKSNDTSKFARKFFEQARTSRAGSVRKHLRTAPGIIAAAFGNRKDAGEIQEFSMVVHSRNLRTAPASFQCAPHQDSFESDATSQSTSPVLDVAQSQSSFKLMRSGTFKDGRPVTGSRSFEPFVPRPYPTFDSLPSIFGPLSNELDFTDSDMDLRPSTWSAEAPPMDVGYSTRRAVSEPADYAMAEWDEEPTASGLAEFEPWPSLEDPEDSTQQTAAAESELRDFGFGFDVDHQDTTPPSPSDPLPLPPPPPNRRPPSPPLHTHNPPTTPPTAIYSHANTTAFRLSSLQTLLDARDGHTPRPAARSDSGASLAWPASTASSSADGGYQSPTYSCPTASVDSPASPRRSGSFATRPSTTALDLMVALHDERQPDDDELLTPKLPNLAFPRADDSPPQQGGFELPALRPTPDLMTDLLGALMF